MRITLNVFWTLGWDCSIELPCFCVWVAAKLFISGVVELIDFFLEGCPHLTFVVELFSPKCLCYHP